MSAGNSQNESVDLVSGHGGEEIACKIEADSSIGDNSDNSLRVAGLSAQVFGNDMLRQHILSYLVIKNRSQKFHKATVCALRLVGKSWLETINQIARKKRGVVFRLTLTAENSVSGTPYCNTNGKLLEKLNATLENSVEDQRTMFGLVIRPDFFRRENYHSFLKCLMHQGMGLLELELGFPLNPSMTMTFPNFYLPNLMRLKVDFTDKRITNSVSNLNNSHLVYPLQSILNSASGLAELHFKACLFETQVPYGLEFLRLPNTISDIIFDCPLKHQDLELLLRNDLPVLKNLSLSNAYNAYPQVLIAQIFKKFRKTLVGLVLRGGRSVNLEDVEGRRSTVLQLPVMERLSFFGVTYQTWVLPSNPQTPVNWALNLPKLYNVKILQTSDYLFRKWTSGSSYLTVRRLAISLSNVKYIDGVGYVQNPKLTGFTAERMKLLHEAFPNVTSLDITVNGARSSICGLKYLLRTFTNLQKLTIGVIGVGGEDQHTEDINWDALLVGVPSGIVEGLQTCPSFWQSVQLADNPYYPSIRNLTELQELTLIQPYSSPAPGVIIERGACQISQVSFYFALFKMPKLKNLIFGGRFKSTAMMEQLWKQEKKTPIYHAYTNPASSQA